MIISTSKNSSEGRVVEMELNRPQSVVAMVCAWLTVLLWGRGTGKTTGGIAVWMVRVAEAMPGHLSGIFGKTFTHLDTNIMPKILAGLRELGYEQGKDYLVGQKPPADWPKCFYPIKDWSRTILWRNGTVFQQISMHDKGSANAFDLQSGVFDEVKFFSQKQLEDEVFPTFRGLENLYGHLPEYLSRIYATDKLANYLELEWILNLRKKVDHKRVEKIIKAQQLIAQLEMSLDSVTPTKAKQIGIAVRRLEAQCQEWRKGLIYVSEASAFDNIKNLGMAWLLDKMENMSPYEFYVAIKNDDPVQSQNGFYPRLSAKNKYKESERKLYDASKPFVVAMDYQHSIAPLDAAQVNGKSTVILKETYSLYPLGIKEAVNQFCKHYQWHGNKKVYYVFDQTAIGKRADAEPFFKIVTEAFKQNKWKVQQVYIGDTPDHFEKYQQVNNELDKDGAVLFNEEGCEYTLVSLAAAGTKSVSGKTQKDKEYENHGKYPHIDQRKTTHFSDVVDQLIYAINILKKVKPGRMGAKA